MLKIMCPLLSDCVRFGKIGLVIKPKHPAHVFNSFVILSLVLVLTNTLRGHCKRWPEWFREVAPNLFSELDSATKAKPN